MDICIFILISVTSTFTISLQYETKQYQKGDDIELSCEDSEPIHWCYPPKYSTLDDINYKPDRYSPKAIVTYSNKSNYEATIKILNASYRYTGYYHCVTNETSEDCNRKMLNVKTSYYVYVADSEHPLVVYGHVTVLAYKNEPVTLPCLPTQPNITIIFTNKSNGRVIRLEKQNGSDISLTYSQTLGIILEPNPKTLSYTCSSTNHIAKKNNFLGLTIIKKGQRSRNLQKPTILRDMVNVEKKIMAREGSTLKLVCRSEQDREVSVDFNWIIHKESRSANKKTLCTSSNKNYKFCYETSLTLNNVTHSDAGTYRCRISAAGANSAETRDKELEVIGENVPAVKIWSSWNSSEPVIPNGNEPMKIVVNYIAPEKVRVEWYGPDGNKLHGNPKYAIDTDAHKTVLRVNNFTVRDTGPYKVEVFDKTSEPKKCDLFAIIQGKPEVKLDPPTKLFNLGKNATFVCNVYSPPEVNITWTFRNCNSTGREYHCVDTTDIVCKKYFKDPKRMYENNCTFHIEEEGIVDCIANNSRGNESASEKIYLTELRELNNTLIVIDKPTEIITGSTFTLSCAGSIYFYNEFPSWELYDGNKKIRTLSNSSGISIHRSRSEYTVFTNLTFTNLSRSYDGQSVRCKADNSAAYQEENSALRSVFLKIQDPKKPAITKTNLDKDVIEVKIREQIVLYCKTEGMPTPKLKWLKDGEDIHKDKLFYVSEVNQSVTIPSATEAHEGTYQCKATSIYGSDQRSAELKLTGKRVTMSIGMLAAIVVLIPVLLGLLIFLGVKIRKERKLQRELNLAGLANFKKGAMENINPELPVDEQADLLPYDQSWEFPTDKLKLGKMLGAGAFGVVMKAEAYGILDDEEKTTVAVKMVKSGTDISYIRALASELKIMTHLGKHLNVVNLLGASTKRLNKMELMVIVEFCRFGNLRDYLIRHREDFVDQVDHNTGEINLAIGLEKLGRSQSTKSKTSLKHRLLSYSSSLIGSNTTGGSSTELQACASPTATEITGIASDMSVVSSPNGEINERLLSCSSADHPEWRVKYDGDYMDSSINICTHNVLCWAFQIARGMEYLANRKVLHGDLAARNVLLADDNIVKICDFGLARSMYKSDNYKKKGGGPLPVKWMALESIGDHIFSTQSDVWSFGIVLWELFSLGKTPYPGMDANERLLEKLLNGYRMEQPSYSPIAVYKTMLKCWKENPDRRPNFAELTLELGAMLDDNIRRHFEELNDPYVNMNEQRQTNDYLSMMSSPNYRSLVSPTSADHEYLNSPCASGYLNMKSPASTNGSVFEYPSPDPGYLNMSPKDGIFSPRPTDENPFKFSPTCSSHKQEEFPMKQMQLPDSDNYMNSISNPTYVT